MALPTAAEPSSSSRRNFTLISEFPVLAFVRLGRGLQGSQLAAHGSKAAFLLYPRWPQSAAVRKALPQYLDRIGSEFRIRADHRKFFGDRLRQDYPVERVAMMGGKLFKC